MWAPKKLIEMPRRRPGFTLVELLVVMAIIAVLVALIAAGVFAVIPGQTASQTRTVVRGLDKILMAHWNEVIDMAKKESIPAGSNVWTLAGNDALKTERARVLWIKLRLMEAFPQSLDELDSRGWPSPQNNPMALKSVTPGDPKINPVCNAVHYFLGDHVSPGRLKMISNIRTARGLPVAGPMPAALDPNIQAHDSATCLLLALSVKRKSSSFSEEAFVSNLKDLDNDKLKEFTDPNGNPLFFYRFAFNNPALDAINPTPGKSASANMFTHDPLDPKGTLMQPAWLKVYGAMYENCFHPILDPSSVTFPRAYFVRPVIVAAGVDFNQADPYGLGHNSPYTELYASPMATRGIPIGNAAQARDNVYSFKE